MITQTISCDACGMDLGGMVMKTEFTSDTFENDYILAILNHMLIELKTGRPKDQVLDKYAVELTAFMNGQIRQAVRIPKKTVRGRSFIDADYFLDAIAVIKGLKIGECWCEMSIGNPNLTSHTKECKLARKYIDFHDEYY